MKNKTAFLLWLLVVIFFLKGLFYCFYIPPWEAPDEPGHVEYAHFLFQNRSFPDMTPKVLIGRSVGESWTKQNILLKTIQKNITPHDKELFQRNNLYVGFFGGIGGYPPLYYIYEVPFYLFSLLFPSYWTLIFLRIGSLILGSISLFIAYKIVRILFPKSNYIPLLTVACIVGDPMFGFITAVINNDAMVILGFLVFILLMLKKIIINKKINMYDILLVGLIGGLSTLAKPQLLSVIPIFCGYILLSQKLLKKEKLIGMCNIFIFPFLWYGLRLIYMGKSSYEYTTNWLTGQPQPFWEYPITFIRAKQPIGIFMSFWGLFGWLNVAMPKWVYAAFFILILLAITGLIYGYKKRIKISFNKKALTFVTLSSLSYTTIIFLYDIAAFAQKGKFLIQGRYFLPITFLIFSLILQGILFFKNPWRYIFLIIVVCVLVLSQVYMYISLSKYYFHRYAIISPLTRIYIHSNSH